MKYILLLLSLFVFWLAGCSFTSEKTNLTPSISYTGNIYPNKEIVNFPVWKNKQNFNQSEWFTVPLTWILSSITTYLWENISIDTTTLTYTWVFTLQIPNLFSEREYHTWWGDSLFLFNQKTHNSFSLHASKPLSLTERENDEAQCKDIVIWSLTTTSENINGQNVYINTIVYPDSSTSTKEICFVRNETVYRVSLWDYKNVKSILDSLVFFEQNTPKSLTHYSWNHILIPNTTWTYNNIVVSWNAIIYNDFFSINIPSYIQFWQILHPSTNLVDIYFVNKIFYGFQMDEISFLHFLVTPISSRIEPTIHEKCIAIQNNTDANKTDIYTGNNWIVIYKTYRSYDSFGYLRKQWSLCFADNKFIYVLNARLYTVLDVKSVLDSFTFLD